MAKGEMKKCSGCGREVASYSYGDYCRSCAQRVWDSGFQSSSDNAYEIGWRELVAELDATSPAERTDLICAPCPCGEKRPALPARPGRWFR